MLAILLQEGLSLLNVWPPGFLGLVRGECASSQAALFEQLQLVEGALGIAPDRPAMAAGWLLLAAHHRMARKTTSVYKQVVRDLTMVKGLAESGNARAQFERSLARFRARYARRRKFLALLDEAGM